LAAHWGDKKLARPQIFATDIAQSVDTIVNPTMPLALRMSGHLLLGVVRIYSRKVKYVLSDCTEAMLKLQMAFATAQTKGKELLENTGGGGGTNNNNGGNHNSNNIQNPNNTSHVVNFGDYEQIHVVEGFCLPMPDNSEWIVADDDDDDDDDHVHNINNNDSKRRSVGAGSSMLAASQSPEARYQPPTEETWVPFDPENEDDDDDEDKEFHSRVSDVELARAAGDSFLSGDEVRFFVYGWWVVVFSGISTKRMCVPLTIHWMFFLFALSHTHAQKLYNISDPPRFLYCRKVSIGLATTTRKWTARRGGTHGLCLCSVSR
jgi:cohesin complex subunit SCC1